MGYRPQRPWQSQNQYRPYPNNNGYGNNGFRGNGQYNNNNNGQHSRGVFGNITKQWDSIMGEMTSLGQMMTVGMTLNHLGQATAAQQQKQNNNANNNNGHDGSDGGNGATVACLPAGELCLHQGLR